MFKKESLLRYVVTSLILCGVYFISAKFGLSFAGTVRQVTVIWPPTGIALAALLIFGVRYWPAIALGAFLANVTTAEPALTALGISLGNTMEAVVGTYFLRTVLRFDESFGRIKDVLKFIFAGVFLAPAISASIGVITLTLSGLARSQEFASVWVLWFVGDAMGALVIVPLVLALKERKYRDLFLRKPQEATAAVICLLLAALFIFTRAGDPQVVSQLKFLIFPFLIWLAVAFAQLGVSVSILAVSVIAISTTLFGIGPFAGGISRETNLIVLQIFIFVSATAAMLLAAAVGEITRAKEEVVESEKKYRQLVELSPDAIFIQSEGRFEFVNGATLALFGAKRAEELLGKPVLDFVPADHARSMSQRMAGTWRRRSDSGVEERITRLDGARVLVEVAAVPLVYQGKHSAQVIMRDIRERKEAEQQLRLSIENVQREKARDEALLESIAEGVVAVDTAGRAIYINNQAEQLFGFTEKEVLGKVFNEMVAAEDERGAVTPLDKRPLQLAINGKPSMSLSYYMIRKDRTKVPVSATASPVMLEGKVAGAIGTYRDVSKEKEIDQAKADFISLVSHQLRSPLTAFKWVLELLKRQKKTSKYVREKIDYLYQSNDRLINLVNDLLSVSKIEVGGATVVKRRSDVKKIISDVVTVLTPDAEAKKQTIAVNIHSELVNSVVDPNLFSEAFKNILDNAIAYGPAGSEIGIRIDQKGLDYVISVHNDGQPIDEKDKPKLFTRFYRGVNATTQRPTGSGLGLFIAKSSIETNGGKIWFESAPKKGTTFFFTVPITS